MGMLLALTRLVQTNKWLFLVVGASLRILNFMEYLPTSCNFCLCLCSRIKNAVATWTLVWVMACFALDTLLRVMIHAREILVDLWLWLRVQVMILLSLLGPSVMAWAIVVRKENQQSTQKSPSTWTG